MVKKLTKEAKAVTGSVYTAIVGVLSSQTTWAGVAALAAPRICSLIGCDPINAQLSIAVFLGWAVKQAAKELGKRTR